MWNFEIEMPHRNFQFRKQVHQTRKTRLNNSINIIFKMFTIKQIVVCLVRNRTTLSYLTKDLDVDEVFCFRHVYLDAKFRLQTPLHPENFALGLRGRRRKNWTMDGNYNPSRPSHGRIRSLFFGRCNQIIILGWTMDEWTYFRPWYEPYDMSYMIEAIWHFQVNRC